MGKRTKQRAKEQIVSSAPAAPFNNALASLGALREQLATTAAPAELSEPMVTEAAGPEPPSADPWRGKLVVRRQRKGHGGKTVTLLEGLNADLEQRRALAKTLAKELGCGVRVVGDDLVLSGDIGDRLSAWLRAQGALQIVRGS